MLKKLPGVKQQINFDLGGKTTMTIIESSLKMGRIVCKSSWYKTDTADPKEGTTDWKPLELLPLMGNMLKTVSYQILYK